MPIAMTLQKGRFPVHVWTKNIEPEAIKQLENISMLEVLAGPVAAMPDVHAGIGATVGSVIPTRKAILPSSVGVDIGCGMIAIQLSIGAENLPDGLAVIRSAIEKAVPVGFAVHSMEDAPFREFVHLSDGLNRIFQKHTALRDQHKPYMWVRSGATLGSGNHFAEICLDEQDRVWVMLHSGSRGIGNQIGRYFIAAAREEMLRLDVHLPDKDLAYLTEGTTLFDDYVEAVGWAQDYAMTNRQVMLNRVLQAIAPHLPPFRVVNDAVNAHHNYVSREYWNGEDIYITRKGAIRAGAGELGIIPGSMGAKSYIVRGLGNPDSYCSCSHGAGRRMSRTKARVMFSAEDLARQTEGVECRKDAGVVDEAPGAYKDIDAVMNDQTDLVVVEYTLKQVLCVKG